MYRLRWLRSTMFRKKRLKSKTSGLALDQRKAMDLPVKSQPLRSSNHFCFLSPKKLGCFKNEIFFSDGKTV